MLDTVKKALRISHTALDDEINRQIAVARLELARVGILEAEANGDGGLVGQAIVTYCLSKMSYDTKMAERYENSFSLMVDELRKTGGYYVQ